MTGRWRVDPTRPRSPWPAVARPSRHGAGRRRSGTARCSRWATCRLAGLGPDLLALETEPSTIVARIRRVDQSRLLGEVLVDQRVVAGVGNMWLAEALWQARLSPWSAVGDVDRRRAQRSAHLGARRDARGGRSMPVRRATCTARREDPVRGAASRFARVGSATRTAPRTGARRVSRRPIQRRGRDSNPRRADYHP